MSPELFDAVLAGDLENARKLLQSGADCNASNNEGVTVLMLAAGSYALYRQLHYPIRELRAFKSLLGAFAERVLDSEIQPLTHGMLFSGYP